MGCLRRRGARHARCRICGHLGVELDLEEFWRDCKRPRRQRATIAMGERKVLLLRAPNLSRQLLS